MTGGEEVLSAALAAILAGVTEVILKTETAKRLGVARLGGVVCMGLALALGLASAAGLPRLFPGQVPGELSWYLWRSVAIAGAASAGWQIKQRAAGRR